MMSECDRVQPRLHALIDKQLDAAEENQIQSHLKECASCRYQWEQLKITLSALKTYPEARAEFLQSLDARLDRELDQACDIVKPPTTIIKKISETLSAWWQPAERWAVITVGIVLLAGGFFMFFAPVHKEFNIVAQQQHLLSSPGARTILQRYHAARPADDHISKGNVFSFSPTTQGIDYFRIGVFYAESISAILTGDESGLRGKHASIQRLMQGHIANIDALKTVMANIEHAISSRQRESALHQTIKIRQLILQSIKVTHQTTTFDIGAWTVGMRYQLLAKSLNAVDELTTVNEFIQRLQDHGQVDTLIAEFAAITTQLSSGTPDENAYSTLENRLRNIEHLLSPT